MKFENTEVWGFEHALRGMRNPKNSWDKSDSDFSDNCYVPEFQHPDGCSACEYFLGFGKPCKPKIGVNDMKLAQALIRAGAEHRKFLRQIFVSVDITAPAYFWAELDTYKIGTVRNSCSFMHKGVSKPFEIEDFQTDDDRIVEILSVRDQFKQEKGKKRISALAKDYIIWKESSDNISEQFEELFEYCTIWESILSSLNSLRDRFLETKDYKYFRTIRQFLPQSYLYKSTITLNYENLLAMCSKGQRRYHKLNEWSGIDDPNIPNFISWARELPYAQEFIFIDEIEVRKDA